MFVLRDKAVFYRWPEVYDALGEDDQRNLQAVVWGLHVHLPRLRLAEALKAKGADNG